MFSFWGYPLISALFGEGSFAISQTLNTRDMRKLLNSRTLTTLTMGLIIAGSYTACKKKDNNNTPTVTKDPITIGCNDDIPNGKLVDDPDRPVDYRFTCKYSINSDVTIDAGTVIEFETDAGLSVGDKGSLSSNGTASAPVIMTGVDKTVGSWKGIIFDSDDTKNKLMYTNIMYAGGSAFNSNGDLGAIVVWADTKLTVQGCKVTKSASYALNANYGGAELTLSNNTFTENQTPMRLKGTLLKYASGSDNYTGNTNDVVHLNFSTSSISTACTWHKISVPYETINSSTMNINDAVTVEPGVEVRFASGGGLKINQNGSFKAVGTALEPIVFRGVVEAVGAWDGIYFGFTTNPLNEIGYAKIMHAGSSMDGAIMMWAKPVLNVHDVAFSDIKTCALYAAPSTSSPNTNLTTGNNTYTNVGGQICGD